MSTKGEKRILSIKEASEYLGVSVRTLYDWAYQKKELPFIKLGGKLAYDIKDLEKYIERKKVHPVI